MPGVIRADDTGYATCDSTHLDAATIDAFNPPKQEKATATGIVQLKYPNTWSANVCELNLN